MIKEHAMIKKLQSNLPEITLRNATLQETVRFLRLRSLELAPDQKELNILICEPNEGCKTAEKIIDKLCLRNVTFREALRAVCLKTGTQYQVDDFAVTIVPDNLKSDKDLPMGTRHWTVPRNFLNLVAPKHPDPEAANLAVLFMVHGIDFPNGSAASYLTVKSSLIVRNTQDQLQLIDRLVQSLIDTEKPVQKDGGNQEAGQKDREKSLAALKRIIIPQVIFKNTTLEELVDFVTLRGRELDPARQGVNVNLFGDGKLAEVLIDDLKLANVPLPVLLGCVCDATDTRFTIEGRSISIFPVEQ